MLKIHLVDVQVDQTNKKNMAVLLSYVGIFVLCILAVFAIIFFAGTTREFSTLGRYDRTVASMEFHDHRL